MGARFSLSLVLVMGVAVVIGVIAGRSQGKIAAAPAATVAPTPIPTPLPGHVVIVPDPSGGGSAIYVPTTLTIHAGQSVTWVNEDRATHTATADTGAFNTDVLSPGDSHRWKATVPGRYLYGDYIDPGLRGAIVVLP